MLKPFLPQLQTTFMKALNDSSEVVRERGLNALTKLVKLSTRVDPLATELLNGSVSQSETRGVQEVRTAASASMIIAHQQLLRAGYAKSARQRGNTDWAQALCRCCAKGTHPLGAFGLQPLCLPFSSTALRSSTPSLT